MKTEKTMDMAENPVTKLHRRTSLTAKMLILTILSGIAIWTVLDRIHTNHLKTLFHEQVIENLNIQTETDYQKIDHYINTFYKAGDFFTTNRNFSDYAEKRGWTEAHSGTIIFHRQPPSWAPESSLLRTVVRPQYAVLIDGQGRPREAWPVRNSEVPSALLLQIDTLVKSTRNRGIITMLDNSPFLVASSHYHAAGGERLASLVLAARIDEALMLEMLGNIEHDHLAALLVSEKEPVILTSCDTDLLPPGVPLGMTGRNFLASTSQEHIDNAPSEPVIRLTTFMPLKKVNALVGDVVTSERRERAIVASTLIGVFVLIMYWTTSRINNIKQHISYFSENILELEPKARRSGDQISALKQQFDELFGEIIDARRKINEQAEEKTHLIVNSAFDAIATTDPAGIITTWNPAAEKLFGWTKEEALGKAIYDVIVPDLHEDRREPIKSIITDNSGQGTSRQVILTTYNRRGHEIPVEFSVSSAAHEETTVLIFIMRDTSERKRAGRRINHLMLTLTKAKKEWEKTFDSVTEQIILVDKDLNLIRCNRSFAESMRSSMQDLAGKNCSEFLLCEKTWLSGIQEGHDQSNRREVQTHDGRWLYVSTMPINDKDGAFLYTIITATDITELKKTQQNLMKSKQELNDRVEDLEKFYDMAVNRELRMKQLKEEISRLRNTNVNAADTQEARNNDNIFNKPGTAAPEQHPPSFLDDRHL